MFKSSSVSESGAAATVREKSAGILSRLVIPALIAILILLLVRICCVNSFPSALFSEDRKFERFTEKIFREELNSNTLNRHFMVADPSAYRLDTKHVSLGDGSLGARKQACASAENYLNTLKTFEREKLSAEHQLTWDIFRDCLETELEGAAWLLYDEPLGPTLGIQAQLPVLLAEYTFRTKGDIEDYLTLLSQIPDYFSTILAFEKAKAEEGLFMSAGCAQEVVKQCQEFIAEPESNYLIEIFDGKIDAVKNLTADEKIAYKSRNRSILAGYVIPAYETMIKAVTTFSESASNQQGLCYYPEGKEYYRYLVKSTVGDDRPIEEIEEAVKVQLVEDFKAIQKLVTQYAGHSAGSAGTSGAADAAETSGSQTSVPQETLEAWSDLVPTSGTQTSLPQETLEARSSTISGYGSAGTYSSSAGITNAAEASGASDTSALSGDPAAMLDELRQKITADFPVLPDASCEVKYVHESLQDYLSPAFYLSPAIDDYTDNVIYINPAGNYSELELFTTLAHEGYPGHLYQSVYFSAQNPDLLRNLLDVGGYTEGWATYVEMYAYSLWDDDPVFAALSQRNRSFTLGLASLLDIGIHYRGYSRAQVSAFLDKLGFGSGTAESLYRTILEAPANYLQYYVGCMDFCTLRDEMKQALGDRFSLREFHRLVLENGPAPFYLLRERLLPGRAG